MAVYNIPTSPTHCGFVGYYPEMLGLDGPTSPEEQADCIRMHELLRDWSWAEDTGRIMTVEAEMHEFRTELRARGLSPAF